MAEHTTPDTGQMRLTAVYQSHILIAQGRRILLPCRTSRVALTNRMNEKGLWRQALQYQQIAMPLGFHEKIRLADREPKSACRASRNCTWSFDKEDCWTRRHYLQEQSGEGNLYLGHQRPFSFTRWQGSTYYGSLILGLTHYTLPKPVSPILLRIEN